MKKITKHELSKLARSAKAEFPSDPALQQVHIARKVLAREAELNGMTYLEYVGALTQCEQPLKRRRVG
jgi:hypothetical protein